MQLVELQPKQTMSSREIAQLCEKRHDNVLKLIRNLIAGGVLNSTTPQEYEHPQNGQIYVEFLSDKRDSLVIVARLSPEFTAAVIDRWQELEAQQSIQLPNFNDPVAAARAWADAMEKQQALAIELKAAEPKIKHYDRVAERKNLVNATQVGAKIGLSAIKLNRHLTDLGVYNRAIKRGKVLACWFIDKGFGEMKQSEAGFDQPLFSHAGEAWIIQKMIEQGVV